MQVQVCCCPLRRSAADAAAPSLSDQAILAGEPRLSRWSTGSFGGGVPEFLGCQPQQVWAGLGTIPFHHLMPDSHHRITSHALLPTRCHAALGRVFWLSLQEGKGTCRRTARGQHGVKTYVAPARTGRLAVQVVANTRWSMDSMHAW